MARQKEDEVSTRTIVKDYLKKETATALEPVCNKNCSYEKEKEELINTISTMITNRLIIGLSSFLIPLLIYFFVSYSNSIAEQRVQQKIQEDNKATITEIKQDVKELKQEFKNWQLQEKEKGKIALQFNNNGDEIR